MRKWILHILIGLLIGVIIGFLFGIFALGIFNITPNTEKAYGVLEIIYYLGAPIGIFATLLAVLVALFGNEFKNYLFQEKCISSISNHFTEVLQDEDDDNPEAIRYECYLDVKNDCGREIANCTVYLLGVEHFDTHNSTPKKIPLQNRMPIYWKYPDLKTKNITQGETARITLFKITPDIKQSKPDNTDAIINPRQLSIIGLSKVKDKYLKSGNWKISYCICNEHRELERFEIQLYWSGVWKSREKEMNNEATINFVKK